MALYKVEWKRSAVKELRGLPKDAVERILKAVEQLSENPYPTGVRKLVGSEHTYRMREGDYRILLHHYCIIYGGGNYSRRPSERCL